MTASPKPALSTLENAVMCVIWKEGRATAEDVRIALAAQQKLNDSTVRTILRRLEDKGYVNHSAVGRAFVYQPEVDSRNVAAEAVRSIINRFCRGSVEDLLIGMVDDEIVSPLKLKELAERIGRSRRTAKQKGRSKKGGT